ncbi:MAG: hypothetical protein ACRD2J_12200 [Thermoanaerobaculia bacterium]
MEDSDESRTASARPEVPDSDGDGLPLDVPAEDEVPFHVPRD